MKRKKVLVGAKARSELLKGATFLADAVAMTIGPYGKNAALQKGEEITNDGVTIAREIVDGGISDEHQTRGARMLLEAATHTEEINGDGTTTALVLAAAIAKSASKYLSSEDTIGFQKTPSEVVAQIDRECKEVIAKLLDMATPIKSKADLVKSALVSVENDELAKMIGETQFDLGKEGIVMAEDTAEKTCSVKVIPGVRTDNGFATSGSITDMAAQAYIVENTKVVLTNYVLQDINALIPISEQLVKQGIRTLVIVARAYGETAIRQCIESSKKGFAVVPLNAPYIDQAEIMKDLVAVLGGRFINVEASKLDDIQLSDLGFAKKITARRWDTIFVGMDDVTAEARIKGRITELKNKRSKEVSEFEKKNLDRRLAQLQKGFGIVQIGAETVLKCKYLKRKADDAVGAVKAAFSEGTVKGAGLAFKEIADTMPEDSILKRPLELIHENIMASAPKDFVIAEWVRDPVSILRVALEQACSIAATLSTAEISVVDETKPPFDNLLRSMLDPNAPQA
jgi:chaperonin GroEL